MKSQSLSDVVQGMEARLRAELNKLASELVALEAVKNEYRHIFVALAEDTAFLHNALDKAKAEAPALIAAVGPDLSGQQEIRDKLQSLESVCESAEVRGSAQHPRRRASGPSGTRHASQPRGSAHAAIFLRKTMSSIVLNLTKTGDEAPKLVLNLSKGDQFKVRLS